MFNRRLRQLGVILFDDPPGGGGGGTPTPTPTPKPRRHEDPEPAPRHVVDGLISRYKGARNAVAVLAADNLLLRRYRRYAKGKATLEDVQAIAPEGTIVLGGDDAKQVQALRALGKSPEEIKKALERVPELEREIKVRDDRARLDDVARSYGYKAGVLGKLVETEGLAIVEVKDEKDDKGETKRKAYVRKADKKDAAPVELEKFISDDETLKDFLPALRTTDESNGGAPTPFPRQSPSQGGGAPKGGGKDLVAERIAAMNKQADAGNPLKLATTPQKES